MDKTSECGHNCEDSMVQSYEGELVCMRCGRVMEEQTKQLEYENNGMAESAKMHAAQDYNMGNALLNSETVQASYVSIKSPGLAMTLGRGSRAKDYQGRTVKPQLQDAYHAGLLADPSRGAHVVEDSLTGKSEVKFSPYDLPTLTLMKQKAYSRAMDLGLDVVSQTLIAGKLKKIYSSLFMNEMSEYAVLVSLLSVKHKLSKEQALEIERELVSVIESMKVKVLSGCERIEKPKQEKAILPRAVRTKAHSR